MLSGGDGADEVVINGGGEGTASGGTGDDVIVLDVVMPVMDGVEFMQWLGEEGCRARLVVVTGYNPHYGRLAEKLGQAKGIGSVTVLNKPVRLHQLLVAIGVPAG